MRLGQQNEPCPPDSSPASSRSEITANGAGAISVRVQPDLRALPDVQSRGRDSGGLSTLLHRRY